jgi:hypothetical protein
MADVRMSAVESAVRDSAIDEDAKTAIISDVKANAGVPDTWIYRIGVAAVGLAIFVPLFAIMAKPGANEMELGQLLLPIATGALGALAGLLAPSPTARN